MRERWSRIALHSIRAAELIPPSSALSFQPAAGTAPAPPPADVDGCKCRCWCRADTARPSQPFARLRRAVLTALSQEIVRQIGQQLERADHSVRLLAQHDLVAATKDLHLPTFQPKLLR